MYIIASAIGTTPLSKEGGLPLFEIKKGAKPPTVYFTHNRAKVIRFMPSYFRFDCVKGT